jgi:hypothetical protein
LAVQFVTLRLRRFTIFIFFNLCIHLFVRSFYEDTTMLGFTKAALAVAVLASSAAGQGETDFLQEPMQLWVQGFAPMLDNNGIVVSADDSTIFATSATGRVAAMKRDGGEYLWDFPIEGGFCNGEVTFSPNGTTLYHAASVGETW